MPCTSSWNILQLLTSKKRKRSPAENIDLTCISSCNGLQLLRLWKRKRFELNDDYTYYVYNPTTMEYKFLNIPEHITNRQYVCASLAFGPSESLHYKVVFLCKQYARDKKFQIEVYSSITGTCKAPVTNTFVGDFDSLDTDTSGIFCNGAIHCRLSSSATSIVYFNVHTDCLNVLPTPPIAPTNIHYFGQSQGRLHLVNSDTWILECSSVLDVYELKRDYSGWFLKYQVELASFASVNQLKDVTNFVSIIDQGEEEEEDLILMMLSSELVEINPKKKTRKRLQYVQPLACSSPLHWSYWASWSSWLDNHKFIPTLTCI